MPLVIFTIFIRIVSNSSLNFFQKLLTSKGEKASVINFYTYLSLSIIGIFFLKSITFSYELLINTIIMGLLGALGNYFIIKALSLADLSSIAPINSYKPIVAMIIGIIYLREIPSIYAILGILLIILGTYFLYNNKNKINVSKKAILFRVLALIFSGAEAIFIKKVILLSNIPVSFALWAISGLIFSGLILNNIPKIKLINIKLLILLAFSVYMMQFSTNYVFAKMNVAYALALFQLSTILSVFLGVKIFNENLLYRKLIASLIMIMGAIIIILT